MGDYSAQVIPVCASIDPVFPCAHPQFQGVIFEGDWGATHPNGVIDSSKIYTPMDYVRQVDALGVWAPDGSREYADLIRRDPDGFDVRGGIVIDKPAWILEHAPTIATIAAGSLLGFGLIDAFVLGAPAAGAVLPSSSLVTGAPITSGIFAAPAAITSQAVSTAALGLLPSAAIAVPGLYSAAAPAITSQAISSTIGGVGTIASVAGRAIPWKTIAAQVVPKLAAIVPAVLRPSGDDGPGDDGGVVDDGAGMGAMLPYVVLGVLVLALVMKRRG